MKRDTNRVCPEGLGVAAAPPRWKMAVVTWVAIYPTVTVLLLVAGRYLEALSVAARTLVLTGVLVPLMTFGLMPAMVWVLRGWLYLPDKKATDTESDPLADRDRART